MTDLIQTISSAMQESKAWPAVYGAGTAEVLARAALTAINEAGLVIVPREPTEMMIDAGYLSCDREDWYGPRSCWEYMIGVAAITTGETGNG